MVRLMATSSKRAYAIPRSTAPRAPAPAAVHSDLYLCSRQSNTVLSVSVGYLGLCGSKQGLFEPSEHVWWIWGFISKP